MAVTRKDVSRIVCILKDLLVSCESSGNDQDFLRPIETAVDTLSSPLFQSLVDICYKLKNLQETGSQIEENSSDNASLASNHAPSCSETSEDSISFSRTNELSQAITDKYETSKPRVVILIKEHHYLGLEITGLSRTGLYISELTKGGVAERCGLLRVGDKLLKVNDIVCDNMASFEILHQIEEIPVNDLIKFEVQYNPTGLLDFMNAAQQHKRQ